MIGITELNVVARAVETWETAPQIVVRDYGVPAVMATGLATCHIHSGKVFTVDDGAGIVELE